MLFYSIAYTFIDIIGTYTTYCMFKIFYEGKEKNKIWEFRSYVAYHIIIAFLYLVIRLPIVMLAANLLMFYLITLNYNASIKERVISVALTYFVQITVEVLVTVLSGIDIAVTEQSELASMLTHINIRIVGFIMILIISKFSRGKILRKGESIRGFIILSIPLSVMYLTILIQPNTISGQLLMFSIIIFIIMNMTSFYLYTNFLAEESQKRKFLEQENKNYLFQYELIKGYSYEMSKLKHDMKNHATIIKHMSETGHNQELIQYVDGKLQDSIKDREYVDSGNLTIDSILNSKILEAESNRIKIKLRIAIPEALKADSYELTVIFSNLLNHAIKETKRNPANKKEIEIILSYDRGLFYVQIIHFEEGESDLIKRKYFPYRKKKYTIDFLDAGDVEKAVKTFSGDFRFNITDQKVEAFVMLYIPLDVWIKPNKK